MGVKYKWHWEQLNGSMQTKASALSKLKAATMYSYISAQSLAKASKRWTKANALSSTSFKATADRKRKMS